MQSCSNKIQYNKLKILKYISFSLLVFLVIFPCLVCNAQARGKAVYLKTLLNRIEKKYLNRDFSLSFNEISTLKAINVIDTASGRAFFRYPGKMRWDYNTPEPNEIITDGKNLWIYRPGENQVVKGNARDLFHAGTGGAFLSNISIIRKFYKLSIESKDRAFINLLMIPKKKTPAIASVHIRISRDTYEVNRIISFNIYGDTTELRFNDIQFRPLDDSLFKFTVPEGADLILMNK